MPQPIQGIHHITAIASEPQRNLDFYTQVLGLRLVKQTVNFDDPGTYHFYFGNETGQPGTILTFFPWMDIRRGKRGLGQVGIVGFVVPQGSLGYWQGRLKKLNLQPARPFPRFDEEVMTLLDPDGLPIELVARAGTTAPSTDNGPTPAEHAIRGFAAPTFILESLDGTADLLTNVFGLKQMEQAGPRFRFAAGDGVGAQADIEVRPAEPPGRLGAGIVHHIAWRAPNDAAQLQWRETLVELGLDVTPVLDRQYFHSIYFREPGGILFEIATDPPGFAIDENPAELGSHLKLPHWLEPQRAEIEQALPPLKLPVVQNANRE